MDDCRLLADGRLFEIADISMLRLGPGDALLVRVDDTRGSALQAADVERIKAVLGRTLGTDRIVVTSSDMSFEILRQEGKLDGS